MKLFSSCDPKYFRRYARRLATSIHSYSPSTGLVLHLMNPDEGVRGELSLWQRKLPRLQVSVLETHHDLTGLSDDERSTFFCMERFAGLLQHLRAERDELFFFDVDSYVRGELSSMARRYAGADLALFTRFEKKAIDRRVLGAGLFVRPTTTAFELLEEVATTLSQPRPPWLFDQETIYRALIARRRFIHALHLDPELVDWRLGERSLVWSGKGKRRRSRAYLALGEHLDKVFEGDVEPSVTTTAYKRDRPRRVTRLEMSRPHQLATRARRRASDRIARGRG